MEKSKRMISLCLIFLLIFQIGIIENQEIYIYANDSTLTRLISGYFAYWQDPTTGEWLYDDNNGRYPFGGPNNHVGGYSYSLSIPSGYRLKNIEVYNSSKNYPNLQNYTGVSLREIDQYSVKSMSITGSAQLGGTNSVVVNISFNVPSTDDALETVDPSRPNISIYRNYMPVVMELEPIINNDKVIIRYQDESGRQIQPSDPARELTEPGYNLVYPNSTKHNTILNSGYDFVSPSVGYASVYNDRAGTHKEAIFTYKLQGGVEPLPDPDPVEPGPKPDVEKPDMDIWIVPRDDDPATPSNRIYEGESIRIKGFASGGSNIRWRFFSKNADQSGDGFIDDLFITDSPDEGAYAVQRARYVDYVWNTETLAYEETNATAEASVSFKVKEIKPPVIEVSGDLKNDNINIVHLREPVEIKTDVYDINEPSEQHPEGFDVVEESWSFIRKSDGKVVLSGNGVLNEDEFMFRKGIFETEQYYTLRTTAYTAFRPIRRTEHDVEVYVENLPPQVELKVVSEDGEAPTFAKEEFDVVVDAVDGDGFIARVDFEVLDNYPELNFLGREVLIPYGNEMYRANYKHISDIANTVTFRVTAIDDRGLDTTLDFKEVIVIPTLYADIEVENEHDIQKKVYRYIGLDFTGSYSNAPFPIDHSKSKIKYRFNDGAWKDISNIKNLNDDNIRIYYPKYPVKDRLEMYSKKDGKFEFALQVFDTKGFDSDEVYKSIEIITDEAPVVNYEIESMQHRITENDVKDYRDRSTAIIEENIDKGYIKVVDKSKSNDGDKLRGKVFYLVYDVDNDGTDNDLEHMVIVTEDRTNGYDSDTEIVLNLEESNIVKVKDLNNVILTFLTQIDGLGDYYIKAKVQEEITQLPGITSPLYNEILQHELITFSDYSNVFIDNLLPTITFEIGMDREINIIVHYDDYIPAEMQSKINELVANLESRGLKVRLTKYENKY